MNKFSIGVDLGGTNLRIAAVDDQGTLVEKVTLGTKVSLGRDRVSPRTGPHPPPARLPLPMTDGAGPCVDLPEDDSRRDRAARR